MDAPIGVGIADLPKVIVIVMYVDQPARCKPRACDGHELTSRTARRTDGSGRRCDRIGWSTCLSVKVMDNEDEVIASAQLRRCDRRRCMDAESWDCTTDLH